MGIFVVNDIENGNGHVPAVLEADAKTLLQEVMEGHRRDYMRELEAFEHEKRKRVSKIVQEGAVDMYALVNSSWDVWDFSQDTMGADGGWGSWPFFIPPYYRLSQKRGEVLPVYLDENQLRFLRDRSRKLCVENPFAQAALENRVNYTVGEEGFVIKAITAPGIKPGDQEANRLVKNAQRVIDRWYEYNDLPTVQEWLVNQPDINGDGLVRDFAMDNGLLIHRPVECEHLRSPTGGAYGPHTSFGIQTDPEDILTIEGYWIVENPILSWVPVFVPRHEITHVKRHTQWSAKRGMPIFYSCEVLLRSAMDLLRAVITTAVVRSKYSVIRKFTNNIVKDAAQKLINELAVTSVQDPITGQSTNIEKKKFGEVTNASANMEYEFPGSNLDAGVYEVALQMVLRACAARCNMPEWMFTADASNSNFSSSLVAEAPSTKNFSKIQKRLIQTVATNKVRGRESMAWRQLKHAIRCNVLDPDTVKVVALSCKGSTIVVRDKAGEAGMNQTYFTMGIKPKTMIQQEQDIDPVEANSMFEQEAVAAAKLQAATQQAQQKYMPQPDPAQMVAQQQGQPTDGLGAVQQEQAPQTGANPAAGGETAATGLSAPSESGQSTGLPPSRTALFGGETERTLEQLRTDYTYLCEQVGALVRQQELGESIQPLQEGYTGVKIIHPKGSRHVEYKMYFVNGKRVKLPRGTRESEGEYQAKLEAKYFKMQTAAAQEARDKGSAETHEHKEDVHEHPTKDELSPEDASSYAEDLASQATEAARVERERARSRERSGTEGEKTRKKAGRTHPKELERLRADAERVELADREADQLRADVERERGEAEAAKKEAELHKGEAEAAKKEAERIRQQSQDIDLATARLQGEEAERERAKEAERLEKERLVRYTEQEKLAKEEGEAFAEKFEYDQAIADQAAQQVATAAQQAGIPPPKPPTAAEAKATIDKFFRDREALQDFKLLTVNRERDGFWQHPDNTPEPPLTDKAAHNEWAKRARWKMGTSGKAAKEVEARSLLDAARVIHGASEIQKFVTPGIQAHTTSLAAHAARERGISDFEANRTGMLMAMGDRFYKQTGTNKILANLITANMRGTIGEPLGEILGKAVEELPVASLAWLGWSTIKKPFAVFRAARDVTHKVAIKKLGTAGINPPLGPVAGPGGYGSPSYGGGAYTGRNFTGYAGGRSVAPRYGTDLVAARALEAAERTYETIDARLEAHGSETTLADNMPALRDALDSTVNNPGKKIEVWIKGGGYLPLDRNQLSQIIRYQEHLDGGGEKISKPLQIGGPSEEEQAVLGDEEDLTIPGVSTGRSGLRAGLGSEEYDTPGGKPKIKKLMERKHAAFVERGILPSSRRKRAKGPSLYKTAFSINVVKLRRAAARAGMDPHQINLADYQGELQEAVDSAIPNARTGELPNMLEVHIAGLGELRMNRDQVFKILDWIDMDQQLGLQGGLAEAVKPIDCPTGKQLLEGLISNGLVQPDFTGEVTDEAGNLYGFREGVVVKAVEISKPEPEPPPAPIAKIEPPTPQPLIEAEQKTVTMVDQLGIMIAKLGELLTRPQPTPHFHVKLEPKIELRMPEAKKAKGWKIERNSAGDMTGIELREGVEEPTEQEQLSEAFEDVTKPPEDE